jgi:hypothetical protein
MGSGGILAAPGFNSGFSAFKVQGFGFMFSHHFAHCVSANRAGFCSSKTYVFFYFSPLFIPALPAGRFSPLGLFGLKPDNFSFTTGSSFFTFNFSPFWMLSEEKHTFVFKKVPTAFIICLVVAKRAWVACVFALRVGL